MKPTAKTAIQTINQVYRQLGGEPLAWLVEPSMVLTLSGARGLGESVIYYQKAEHLEHYKQIVSKLRPILADQSILLTSQTMKTPSGADIFTINIFSIAGAEYAISKTQIEMIPYRGKSSTLLRRRWIDENIKKIAKLRKRSKMNASHIVMGVLLGYPDLAILGMDELWDNFDRMLKESCSARIRYASKYSGAQPVYDYPKDLRNNQKIMNHEKLWSKILTIFYRSSLHRRVETNKDFLKLRRQMQRADRAAMPTIVVE